MSCYSKCGRIGLGTFPHQSKRSVARKMRAVALPRERPAFCELAFFGVPLEAQVFRVAC